MLPLRRHTTAVRAGVVGVGNMGANHARVYASMPHRAELVGVYDPNLERAQQGTEGSSASDRRTAWAWSVVPG